MVFDSTLRLSNFIAITLLDVKSGVSNHIPVILLLLLEYFVPSNKKLHFLREPLVANEVLLLTLLHPLISSGKLN